LFRKKTTSRQERGQTLIVAALFMAVVMGFTAMAIDVGMFLEDRRQLQNGADAAALAGVQYLPQQPDTAISTARQWAANNGIPSSEIQSVTVTTTSYANDTLTVQLNKSFGWIFGRVLGKTTSPVGGRCRRGLARR
jgi:uncharacterized membrane protein